MMASDAAARQPGTVKIFGDSFAGMGTNQTGIGVVTDQVVSNVLRDGSGRVVSVSALVQGVLHGETVLYSNGKVAARIPFVAGKQHGVAAYFDRSGEITMRAAYLHGRLEGESLYYGPGGKLARKAMYSGGMLHGRTVDYYPDGSPREIAHYAADVQEGDMFRFNEQGGITERLCFAGGKRKPCREKEA
jgi:MORN repeat variant